MVVASDKDRRVAHPPEVCYISSHYSVLTEKSDTLRWKRGEIPVKEFVALDERNPTQKENVIYVYKVGNQFTNNYFNQQFKFAFDRMTMRESQILLIRASGADEQAVRSFFSKTLEYF